MSTENAYHGNESPAADPGDLLVEVVDGVATITMNRPESLNPLSAGHFRQLHAAFREMGNRRDVGVVVLTGAGRAFSAGGDLRTLNRQVIVETASCVIDAILAIRRCPKPVLARINGDAVGAGNELVIACDLAIAAESARLGQAGTRLGWAPVTGATNFFSQSVGDKRAREVIFLSKIVPARVALDWGWINEVVPDAELDTAVQRWCKELMDRSPSGLRLAKTTANLWWDMSYASMASGVSMQASYITDEIISEGVNAFFERRSPNWPERR